MAKKRFKRRRHISSEQLFGRKMDNQLRLMDYSINQAFPDPVKKQKYIRNLIAAFDKDLEEKNGTASK